MQLGREGVKKITQTQVLGSAGQDAMNHRTIKTYHRKKEDCNKELSN